MVAGLVDADLGGHLVKKRVALKGRGKSGGARTIVATRFAGQWFFLYGFEKNQRANIGQEDLKALRKLADKLLELDSSSLADALAANEIEEVHDGTSET